MSSKEIKPFEKVKNEFKQFFKGAKYNSGQSHLKLTSEPLLSTDIEYHLCSEVTIHLRIKTIKHLQDNAASFAKLEENAIEKICGIVEDILHGSHPKEYRHTVLNFYQALIQSQYERLGYMRAYFFKIIKHHDNVEDNIARLKLFQKLTENGKIITCFEEEVGPFLLQWMPGIVMAGRTSEFLLILVNYIKYNAAYIDDDIISGIVQNISFLCCKSEIEKVVTESLEVLDAIVCYSRISQQTMTIFVTTLSRTVCLEAHNAASWKIMRNLLGTHMGQCCLQTLCTMLKEDDVYSDIGLTTGIIFNLNMAILNNKPESIFDYIPTIIIPAISKAVQSCHIMVVLEVCFCVKWLVEKYGDKLKDPCWDQIFEILENIMLKIDIFDQPNECLSYVTDIFNRIDSLLTCNQFKGNTDKLFSFAYKWNSVIPERLVLRLIDYLTENIVPVESNWIDRLQKLMKKFFLDEIRTSIRIKILNVLRVIIDCNRYQYEAEIIEFIICPYFGNIVHEQDINLRNKCLEFLLQFCYQSKTPRVELILDILEKVLNHPFENQENIPYTETNCTDIRTVVKGLREVFALSIYRSPPSHSSKVLSIMVTFLQNHYENPTLFESTVDLRWTVIECLLRLRADIQFRLGYSNEMVNPKYSPFIIVDYGRSYENSLTTNNQYDERNAADSEITFISLSAACRIIVVALKTELDWNLLQLLLKAIPVAFKNKAILLSSYNKEIESLINALIVMITDTSLPDTLKNIPPKFTKPDFYGYVIPAISAFASYHKHIEFNQQQRIILCLEVGLVNKSAPLCVTALMTCLLEMREAMVKHLPQILLTLSKISDTVHVAIPILEFLSMLTNFPRVFANFITTQYMSIFAIIFPYTNPFRYHHYTVSLAHHVIAAWFLKCRRPLRRDFVKYIIKGLKGNVISSFEDRHFVKSDLVNEDSSNRKRSSSLTEQGNKKKERHMSAGRLVSSQTSSTVSELKHANVDETSVIFHRELTETCIDLMSRVAFTGCSALPKKHPSSEFILKNGISMTWLLGTKLITITTSACTQKAFRNGLCEKCSNYCLLKEANEFLNINTEAVDINLFKVKKSFESNEVLPEGADNTSTIKNEDHHTADDSENQDQCICWCQGWAEIYIRRPTGDTSWIMRLQNEINAFQHVNPLNDPSTVFQTSMIRKSGGLEFLGKVPVLENQEKHISRTDSEVADVIPSSCQNLVSKTVEHTGSTIVKSTVSTLKEETEGTAKESLCELPLHQADNFEYRCCHSRNPVRRSNSSPEMTSSWKCNLSRDSSRSFSTSPVSELENYESANSHCPALDCKKSNTKTGYTKELRCNCEAIPEEFPGLGTTPPKQGVKVSDTILETLKNFEAENNINGKSDNNSSSTSSIYRAQHDQTLSTYETASSNSSSGAVDIKSNEQRSASSNFFDDKCMPNENFEFNRSASVSQVVPPFKKIPSSAAYIALSNSLTSSQPHLTTKPPLSPPNYSSRFFSKQDKFTVVQDCPLTESHSESFSQLNQDYKRSRVHTISVMSPTKKPHIDVDLSKTKSCNNLRNNEPKKSGINPSFVFLHLYESSHFSNPTSERPILVPMTAAIQRAVNVFDRIPPYETHKVGVMYVGPGQTNNEIEILRNTHGSTRYAEFLSKLGVLVNLEEVNSQNIFLGGLEQSGNDGKFAYIWKDDVMQVIFHVATLMPNTETDAKCNNKKKHIGNDYVTIVFNESGEEYDLRTVKCQFNFACLIIEPLDHGRNQLTIKAKEDLKDFIGSIDTKIVTNENVSLLARQLALHLNLASLIACSIKNRNCGDIYASNWLERLRKIKQIKNKVLDEQNIMNSQNNILANKQTGRRSNTYDFTEYT